MSYSNEAIDQSTDTSKVITDVDPRRTEIAAFEKATVSLKNNHSKAHTDPEFLKALNNNKLLWKTLENDLTSRDNKLPDALKAKLISVAMWVDRHSCLVEKGEAKLGSLIEVNESIIKGLEASTEQK